MALSDQWSDGVLHRADIAAHLREVFPLAHERRPVYEGVCACASAVSEVLAERARKRAADARSASAR